MQFKNLLSKTLLVASLLVGGVSSAWADPIETVGTTSSAWWTDFSNTYTLEGYGTYNFKFTTTNANDGNVYKTWLLVATDGDYPSSYNGKGGSHTGTEYFVWRGEGYAWGQGKNSNPYDAENNASGDPTRLVCSNTYSGSNLQAAMNGASVDMTVTRKSTNISVRATVTPTNGDSEFTMSFDYLFGNAISENIGLFLTVENAQVVLNTAEQTKQYTRYFYQDFEDAETYTNGWTINADLGPSQGTCTATSSKTLYMKNGSGGTRSFSTSYTSNSAFTGATDYIYEFDFNYGACNANATSSTLTIQSNNAAGKLFTLDKTSAAWSSAFNISNAAGTKLLGEDLAGGPGYSTSAYPLLYHFTVEGISGDGVYLTVTNGSSTSLVRTRVADFGAVTGLSSNMGKNNTAVAFDNISLKSYSDVEVVPIPSAAITGVNGTKRIITLTIGEGSKDGTTMAYSTNSDMSDATPYSTPFEVNSTGTIYFQSTSPTSATSDIQSIAVTCEAITLNMPTWTKTGYSAGVSTVTFSSDQSSKLLSPTADIYYKIDGGSATKYTEAISVNDGETLTYYATATGYTNSAEGSVTAVAPNSNPTLWTESYVASTDKQTITRDGDAVMTVNTTDYFYMTAATDGRISNRLLTSTADGTSNWLYRTGGIYGGAALGFAVTGVKAGDYVVITYSRGDGDPVPNATDGSKDEWNSTSTSMGINVTGSTGVLRFTIARYGYIKSVTVYAAPVSVTVTAAGFATYVNNDYDLDFTSTSIEAYKVKVSTKGTATLTKVNQVPAGTPVLLYKEGGATEAIPVMTGAAAVSDNDLVAGTGAAVATSQTIDEVAYTNMILNDGASGIGFYFANGQTVAADHAYLHITSDKAPDAEAGARPMNLVFEDMTGINSVKGEEFMVNGSEIYNLQGQRVAQPAKGLYIINGKKVMVK